jgi:hypothetical protein
MNTIVFPSSAFLFLPNLIPAPASNTVVSNAISISIYTTRVKNDVKQTKHFVI